MAASRPELEILRRRVDAISLALAKELGRSDPRGRDLPLLDALLAESLAIVRSLEHRPSSPDQSVLLQRIRAHAQLLKRERSVVAEQHDAEPARAEEVWISEPGARANVYMSLARRHFAPGVSRVDTALLPEIIEGLERAEADLVERTPASPKGWMVENLAQVRNALAGARAQHAEFVRVYSNPDMTQRLIDVNALLRDQQAFVAAEAEIVPDVRRPARLRHVGEALRLLVGRLPEGSSRGAEVESALATAARFAQELARLEAARAAAGTDAFGRALELEGQRLDRIHQTVVGNRSWAAIEAEKLELLADRAASLALQAATLWNQTRTRQHDLLRVASRHRHTRLEHESDAVRGWTR